MPSFQTTATHNSLSFEDPNTRTSYQWLSNRPFSCLGDERYDYQRNALFTTRNGKKVIVADFSWWDGHATAPEHCLTIRDPDINHGLVIASLTLLHDWQWKALANERAADPKGFNNAETTARLTPLGLQAYWHAGDTAFRASVAGAPGSIGRKGQKVETKTVLEGVNNGLELANAMMGAVNGSSSC